mmetsp:Transcript_22275/g.60849  ORF Transcript_22275/g.60849 Transcript_22275/m.60849 type:complete len:320 (-) Transcript_22275:145-1104(-)
MTRKIVLMTPNRHHSRSCSSKRLVAGKCKRTDTCAKSLWKGCHMFHSLACTMGMVARRPPISYATTCTSTSPKLLRAAASPTATASHRRCAWPSERRTRPCLPNTVRRRRWARPSPRSPAAPQPQSSFFRGARWWLRTSATAAPCSAARAPAPGAAAPSTTTRTTSAWSSPRTTSTPTCRSGSACSRAVAAGSTTASTPSWRSRGPSGTTTSPRAASTAACPPTPRSASTRWRPRTSSWCWRATACGAATAPTARPRRRTTARGPTTRDGGARGSAAARRWCASSGASCAPTTTTRARRWRAWWRRRSSATSRTTRRPS